uniref:chloroplast protein-transporting ATPase n=1 Tax=Lactuca sativa TaxID=4236 RepID=A0A9R1XBI0_LACSA|nr:hypothetical protein LSAT_V11C500250520 [Lactuca sativa]
MKVTMHSPDTVVTRVGIAYLQWVFSKTGLRWSSVPEPKGSFLKASGASGGNKIQETSSIDALNSYPGLMSSGPCCLTIQLMDVGNAKTDVVAVSVDHNFSTYLHNGFLSVVPGKKDSGIMLQRNKCQFSGIEESSAISAVMEGIHVVNGLEYKMYCSSSKADSVVVAQITYQSMFKLYPKLSGMTGTAKTEEKEFLKMFQMPVIEVPTNMANIRHDLPIQAFANARGWEYVRAEVESMFRVGRPVLVGTTSVENSEYLSALLRASKIPHNVLNARPKVAILSFGPNVNVNGIWFWVNNAAKYMGKSENKSWTYEKAKSIISESIEMSQSVGLDELQRLVEEQAEMYPLGPCISIAYLSVLKDCEIHCFHEGLEVKRLGGLHVIGTSLHESRRIDNQSRKARRSWINTLHGQKFMQRRKKIEVFEDVADEKDRSSLGCC